MAFNFLNNIDGIEKFEEFKEFVEIESLNIEKKINHLNKEKIRLLSLLDKFKKADQYLRKDYPLSERADIDYIKKPRPNYVNFSSRIDPLTSSDVSFLKNFVLDQIKYKRENNEYRIKKIRDKVEQITNEIIFLRQGLLDFENTLNSIRTRFDLEDYTSMKKVETLDPKNIDPTIPVTPRNQGREIIDGVTFYLATSIKSFNRTITFDTAAPTVKPNQIINLVNGRNNGSKTVRAILSSTTIQVYEDLLDETPSVSKISIG
jgi:hypothetical protein